MKINFIDIDGTLCRSIFNNERLKNDNKNCLKADFLHDLQHVEPYGWARHEFGDDINIIVTGRLPAHEKITIDWFYDHCMKPAAARLDRIAFVSVPWDDTKTTREASYNDYVMRKFETLKWLALEWYAVLNQSRIGLEFTAPFTYKYTNEIHVYEDDTNVLRLLATGVRVPGFMLHVVDKDGEVHDYP